MERNVGPPFAELCAKTNFSLLEGASRPEEMVEAAHTLGLFAIGLADARGLYGSVRAHIAAQKLGQRYIVGSELLVLPPAAGKKGPFAKVVLLVESKDGYTDLCRLLTRAHAELPREEALLSFDTLARHTTGIFPLLLVPTEEEMRRDGLSLEASEQVAGPLRDIFGDRAFLATSRLFLPDDRIREAWAKRIATEFGLSLVATGRPIYHHPSRKPLADVLQCIREGTTLDRAKNRLAPNAQSFLRTPSEMRRLFSDSPDRLARTVEIAKTCTFSLSELKYSFPSDDLCPGETPDDALRRLVRERTPWRYPHGIEPGVARQLEKELFLIAKIGVAQFFLSVYEIIRIAEQKRILCQGRGSAANSVVCYVLGITAVDPARSNLLFERFLSCERNEPPDIDVDFEHERREEVIQAIFEKYGRDRAAMVSEVICYRGKSALRETAKVFGLSLEQADRLTQLVGPHDALDVSLGKRLREIGFDADDGRIQLIMKIAGELQGFPRHMSTHVGGFVLSARPLDEVSPVEPAKMPGRTVVPWDKDDIDALGFFKVDVLGLGMLTAIRKALELIHLSQPILDPARELAAPFDPLQSLAAIPPEDPRVYDAVCKADTIGIFQIESRAQMAMLPRMKPRRFYDLVIEVAIVRPGPIQGGMVHPYLRRRNKEEPATMPHPSLASILQRTLGVPLFQEQVMQIAMTGAGYTAGEADELRRDMAAWKRSAKLLRHEDKLVRGFVERGIPREFAERLFSQIKGFGEYGFPESHAASFALLVYASAWIKVHHPLEFACALINSQPMGFYSVSSIVRDAQKRGVSVLAPDVLKSDWDCIVEAPPTGGPSRFLRLGLRVVKGMGEEPARRIMQARGERPFRDTKDLSVRAELRTDQMDALAEAGALSSLTSERRNAMWQVREPDQGPLFEQVASNEPSVSLPPLAEVEQLRFDYARLGLSVDDHPMRHLRARMKKRGVVTSAALFHLRHGTVVKVAGLVLSRQRPMTASGVVFVTLEDEFGMMNLILTPDIFDRSYRTAVHARLLLVQGKLERTPRTPQNGEHPVIHVLVEKLEALQLPGGLEARSRDFR
ncbi:MAG TPA: error-prone DNA polymerase [Polyangiaceae bacterium]|nr:error-prone DNA polymerase [Polyangiaceae bacterium]